MQKIILLFAIMIGTLVSACAGANPSEDSETLGSVEQAACPLPPQDPLELKWFQYTVGNAQGPGEHCDTSKPANGYWAPGWAKAAIKAGTVAQGCDWIVGGWRVHTECGTPQENLHGAYVCQPPGGSIYDYWDSFLVTKVAGTPWWIGGMRRTEKKTPTSPICSQVWTVIGLPVDKPAGWPN